MVVAQDHLHQRLPLAHFATGAAGEIPAGRGEQIGPRFGLAANQGGAICGEQRMDFRAIFLGDGLVHVRVASRRTGRDHRQREYRAHLPSADYHAGHRSPAFLSIAREPLSMCASGLFPSWQAYSKIW